MVNILSVNVNGLSSDLKRSWIRDLGRKHRCNVVCLQESHLQSIEAWIVKTCWGMGSCEFVFVSSIARSGGAHYAVGPCFV